MKKSKILLTVLAFSMVLGLSIGSAMAYFTTFVTAKGGVTIRLGDHTTITEPEVTDWTKHIVIHNDGPDACYVRAKAFAGSTLKLTYTDLSGGLWTDGGDGYWYYDFDGETKGVQPVPAGEDTQELLVKIDGIPTDEDVKKGKEDFNVVVVYESVPALYDESGSPYADWTQEIQVDKELEGGNS